MKNHIPAQAVYQQQDLHLNQAWFIASALCPGVSALPSPPRLRDKFFSVA